MLSGFSELAKAIWQGICEINSSFPKTLGSLPSSLTEHDEALRQLGIFWDSETLRIGELGAKGLNSLISNDVGEFPSPKDIHMKKDEVELDMDDQDFFGVWAARELALSGKFPARTTDEVEEDDPYRVIFFRDLEPFIYCFQSEEVKKEIPSAFLAFSNVMLRGQFHLDTFIRQDLASLDETNLAWFWPTDESSKIRMITWLHGEAMEPERVNKMAETPFNFKSPDMPLDMNTAFPASFKWFSAMDISWSQTEEAIFISQVLKELTLRDSGDNFAIIYLAFEYRTNFQNVKKTAKSLIKKFPSSMVLYTAYAIIEWRSGKREAARNVFATAVKMSKELSRDGTSNVVTLWRSWVWEELQERENTSALEILLSIPEEGETFRQGYSAPAILKARRVSGQHKCYYLHRKANTKSSTSMRSSIIT